MTMTVGEARALARRWVSEEGSKVPGFAGAYLAGSTNWLPDDALFPAASDLDVNVVLDADAVAGGSGAPDGRTKFDYHGVLLEATYLSAELLRSPEAVLGHYHLAGGLSTPSVVLDPTGYLTELQRAVSRDYARRDWVLRRCEDARDKVLRQLEALDESGPFVGQVIAWLFGTGVTTHVLLTAGLRNPTVRRRYAAARELLADYGRLDEYERLLKLLGCDAMAPERVAAHVEALAEVFDVAEAVLRSPFVFAADISGHGRHAAIDGSRELIEQGYHREAVFWIAVTFSRCRQVLDADAPAGVAERFHAGYGELLADLGVRSPADVRRRRDDVVAALPALWALAESIVATNRGVRE